MLHLLNYLPKQLAEYIKEKNKKIYIYGAGMIGQMVVPDSVSYTHLTLPTT